MRYCINSCDLPNTADPAIFKSGMANRIRPSMSADSYGFLWRIGGILARWNCVNNIKPVFRRKWLGGCPITLEQIYTKASERVEIMLSKTLEPSDTY